MHTLQGCKIQHKQPVDTGQVRVHSVTLWVGNNCALQKMAELIEMPLGVAGQLGHRMIN